MQQGRKSGRFQSNNKEIKELYMITKKEFAQAISDNAEVVAGAVPVVSRDNDGLFTSNDYRRIHVCASNSGNPNQIFCLKVTGSNLFSGFLSIRNNANGMTFFLVNLSNSIGLSIYALENENKEVKLYKSKEPGELYIALGKSAYGAMEGFDFFDSPYTITNVTSQVDVSTLTEISL